MTGAQLYRCPGCECTDDVACSPPCWWVEEIVSGRHIRICSSCAQRLRRDRRRRAAATNLTCP